MASSSFTIGGSVAFVMSDRGHAEEARRSDRRHAEEAWRRSANYTSASFPHTQRRRCQAVESTPTQSNRARWVAARLSESWRHRGGHRRLRVLEVGPCNMQVRFAPHLRARPDGEDQWHVSIEVADYTKSPPACMQAGSGRVDVITDAQTMGGVPSGRYDALLAFHVLEHMPDPLGAISAWLRVLQPGGLLFVGVPDLCASENNIDHLRRPPTLEHLLDDFSLAMRLGSRAEELLNHSAQKHRHETAISLATAVLDIFWDGKKHPADDAMRRQAPTPGRGVIEQRPHDAAWRWMLRLGQTKDVHQSHFHAWDVPTMRETLGPKTQALLRKAGTPFSMVEVLAARQEWLQMQELHLCLRREVV